MKKNKQYDEYLENHIFFVKKGYDWLKEKKLIDFKKLQINEKLLDEIIANHDKSKYSEEEYDAYAEYFYGEKNQEEFDRAWLHHQKENPHHWQYWVLINDEDGTNALEIPKEYIFEMICDWWAFSWAKNNLTEIFNWYKNNKENMILHDETRKFVEDFLKILEEVISLELFGLKNN